MHGGAFSKMSTEAEKSAARKEPTHKIAICKGVAGLV